jgi:hypothetical protein
MRIEIRYQRHTDLEPQILILTPELYFESLEPGESYEESGVPRYNHAREYLGFVPDELKWTEVRILEAENSHTIRTIFYGQNGSMWHRVDADGYEEICLETKMANTV